MTARDKIINKFHEEYFKPDLLGTETKITLAEYMKKTPGQQKMFIKAWAITRRDKMTDLDTRLVAQRNRVANEKVTLDSAITEL